MAPDHKAVKIDINLSKNNQGPGSWKFNNSLLNVEEYVKLMQNMPSAFIVSRCLEPLMKPEARVFNMASQSRVINNR